MKETHSVQLIAVFAKNQKGQLSRCAGILAQAGINIHWVGIASVNGYGIIRFLVNNPTLAYEEFRRHHLTCTMVDILAVEIPNQPGSLYRITALLAEADINLINCSGFVFHNRAILLLEPEQMDEARQVLQQHGYSLLTREQLLNL